MGHRTASSLRKNTLLFFALPFLAIFTTAMDHPSSQLPYTYLALGDSYTIGEGISPTDNYPSRTVALLKQEGLDFATPTIIAETGWTTTDLQTAIAKAQPAPRYDFVTLLIGVNNEYRNADIADFITGFTALLRQAIGYAGNNPSHVAVLSIPDWSVTPYAKTYLPDQTGRDAAHISSEIDDYNAACRRVTADYHVSFIDITSGTREAAGDPSLLTHDGLHPSAIEYDRWARKLSTLIKNKM